MLRQRFGSFKTFDDESFDHSACGILTCFFSIALYRVEQVGTNADVSANADFVMRREIAPIKRPFAQAVVNLFTAVMTENLESSTWSPNYVHVRHVANLTSARDQKKRLFNARADCGKRSSTGRITGPESQAPYFPNP